MYLHISQINRILEAMHWIISPYAESDLTDYPHILFLAETFNSLLTSLEAQGFDHQYEFFNI